MSTTAHKQRKAAYDPARQWGLKPEVGSRGPDGESTYVLGGHIASSARAIGGQAPGMASDKIGREGQARAKRRKEEHDEKALEQLLGESKATSSGGSREALEAVRRAREAALESKTNAKVTRGMKRASTDGSMPEEEPEPKLRKTYTADTIKRLGFDPVRNSFIASSDRTSKKSKAAPSDVREPLSIFLKA